MVKKKFYLYKMLNENLHSNLYYNKDGVIWSYNFPLLGLDRNLWRADKIKSVEGLLCLKPFEVEQRNYERLIILAKQLNITILSIKFTDELGQYDFNKLVELLQENDPNSLLDFIEIQKFEQLNEIEEITFASFGKDNKPHYTSFSRDAVLTLDVDEDSLNDFLSAPPIALLSGNYLPYDDLIN